MAELRFRNASRSLGHICVVFCGENMGWEGRTVPTAYWVESQPRWAQIHRTTGEESNIYIHTRISCFSFWSHSLSLTPVLSMTSEHLVQIHIQTKLSFLSVHFPSDSLQKSKWDHLWTERWLLCSWVWSEGIVQTLGMSSKINSRPSSNLVIYQSSNSLRSLGFFKL